MELNFDAQVRVTEALLPLLRRSAPSAIVNVASTAGRVARGGTGSYSASKFALAGWTDALHLEEASNGVHVGLVLPGFVATEGFPQRELVGRMLTRWIVSTPDKRRRGDPRRRPGRQSRALRAAAVLAGCGGAGRRAAARDAGAAWSRRQAAGDDDAPRLDRSLRTPTALPAPRPACRLRCVPYATLRYEVADAVATIALDQPDTRNALSDAVLGELLQAFERARDDDAVRCVVLGLDARHGLLQRRRPRELRDRRHDALPARLRAHLAARQAGHLRGRRTRARRRARARAGLRSRRRLRARDVRHAGDQRRPVSVHGLGAARPQRRAQDVQRAAAAGRAHRRARGPPRGHRQPRRRAGAARRAPSPSGRSSLRAGLR